MAVTCPNCGRALYAEEANRRTGLARCDECRCAFPIAEDAEFLEEEPGEVYDLTRPDAATVAHDDGGVTITWRWLRPYLPASIMVGIPATIVLVGGLLATLHGDAVPVWLVPAFAVMVAFCGYNAVASLLNRIEVAARNGRITVRHYPLPWTGGKTIPAKLVRQVVLEPGAQGSDVILLTDEDKRLRLLEAVRLDHAECVVRELTALLETSPPDGRADDARLDAYPGFSILHTADAVIVRYVWYVPLGFIVLGIGLFFLVFGIYDSGLWAALQPALAGGAVDFEVIREPMALLFSAAGLWVLYLAVAILVNRTDVIIRRGSIRVRHHPLPWSGNRTIAVTRIEQVLGTDIPVDVPPRGRRRNPPSPHAVVLVLPGDERVPLLKGLDSLDQARAFARQIRTALRMVEPPPASEALICPRCAYAMQPDQTSQTTGAMACRRCGEPFRLDEQGPPGHAPDPPLPYGITVSRRDGGVRITRVWRTSHADGLAINALIFNAVVALIIVLVVRQVPTMLAWRLPNVLGIALLVGLLGVFVGVAVYVTREALAMLLNRTVITVEGGTVSVRHAPIRWAHYHDIPATEAIAIFCEEYRHGTALLDRVCLRTPDDRRFVLLDSLSTAADARAIAHEIERALGLADLSTTGETPPA